MHVKKITFTVLVTFKNLTISPCYPKQFVLSSQTSGGFLLWLVSITNRAINKHMISNFVTKVLHPKCDWLHSRSWWNSAMFAKKVSQLSLVGMRRYPSFSPSSHNSGILGLVGNLLSLAVLFRKEMKQKNNTFNNLLIGEVVKSNYTHHCHQKVMLHCWQWLARWSV